MVLPIAIGALVGGLGKALAIGITKVTFAQVAAGALIGGALAGVSTLLAPKPPKLDFGANRADTRHTVREAVSPARWIVGRARVGGVMVFYHEADKNNLHLALVLSEGTCDGIERVWADGDEIPLERDDQVLRPAPGDKHRGKITIHEYFAADGSEGQSLRAVAGSDWTTSHRLEGLSWVHVHLHQPDYGDTIDNRFWARLPELNFLVRGIKITWPGQTAPRWTENAAAIRYWWLRERRGVPVRAIDEAGFHEAYVLSSQTIHFALPEGYEDYATQSMRYAVNGVIHADDDPERIEAELDYAWQGWAVEAGGVYHFRPGVDRPVQRTITPDDIISIEAIRPAPALQDRINAATVSLAQSREHDWLEASLPELTDEAGLRRDGERLAKDLGTRALVADPVAAGRLLAIALRRARANATFTYRLKPGPALEWLSLRPSDRVQITDPEHGLEDFPALVERVVVNPDWSATLDLSEHPGDLYADTLVLPTLKPRTIAIPRRREVPPVTGLAAREGFIVSRDGTVVWHIDVRWDTTPWPVRLVVENADGILHTEARADGTAQRVIVDGPGTWTVSALHVTSDGFASPAETVTLTFGWDRVPVPTPVVLSAEIYGSLLQIVAAPIVNRDVAGLELRYRRGPLDGTTALAIIDDAGWLGAPRADVALAAPLSGDQPLVANALIPRTGRYRLFVRLFNRLGSYGPIVELGYKRMVIPVAETINLQEWPLWSGTANNLFLWPHDDEYHLFPDYDDRGAITLDAWNHRYGWPFGDVEGYGEPMNEQDSTWYETATIDLDKPSNVDVVADIEFHVPPRSNSRTEHVIYAWHGLSADRRAMTRIALTGDEPVRINAVRYLVFRIHLTRWYGAALTRFSVQIRRLT